MIKHHSKYNTFYIPEIHYGMYLKDGTSTRNTMKQ